MPVKVGQMHLGKSDKKLDRVLQQICKEVYVVRD